MNGIRLFFLLVVSPFLGGCDTATTPTHSTEQAADANDQIPELGERIASLSNADASELSAYLSDVHGIVSAGQQRVDEDKRRDRDSFNAEIVSLGDRIAALSLADSTLLSKHLASDYGIVPHD